MASLTCRLWVTHFVKWVCRKGTVSLKPNNFKVRPFFAEDFFFCLMNTAKAASPTCPLSGLFAYSGNERLHGLWTSCYSLPAYHVSFFVRKITRVYKSFWWIEPFIFRSKWIEQFGALGLHITLVWAPPTALTFYSGACGFAWRCGEQLDLA